MLNILKYILIIFIYPYSQKQLLEEFLFLYLHISQLVPNLIKFYYF
jgi:hypothetical protein